VLTVAFIAEEAIGLLVESVLRAAVLEDSENVKLALTEAVTYIWSQACEPLPQLLATIEVAQLLVSKLPDEVAPEPTPAQLVASEHVVITPVWSFPAVPVVTVEPEAVVQLKQYQVLAVKFEPVNSTVLLVLFIWLALLGAVIPGQAVAVVVSFTGSLGQPVEVVLTAQFAAVVLRLNAVGKVTAIESSVCTAALVLAIKPYFSVS
jgi:hypothetical protein